MTQDCEDFELLEQYPHRVRIYSKTKRGIEFAIFAEEVAKHVNEYTVPQYGDKGNDKATNYSPQRCIEEIEKYCARFGKNVRPGQELRDLMKIAHYAAITYSKLKEQMKNGETGAEAGK